MTDTNFDVSHLAMEITRPNLGNTFENPCFAYRRQFNVPEIIVNFENEVRLPYCAKLGGIIDEHSWLT